MHSEVCKALGGFTEVVHSIISVCGSLRSRSCPVLRDASASLSRLSPGARALSPFADAHTFSAFWLRSSVVSVLISMTTDMLPNGSNSVIKFLVNNLCSSGPAGSTNSVATVLHVSCPWHGARRTAARVTSSNWRLQSSSLRSEVCMAWSVLRNGQGNILKLV